MIRWMNKQQMNINRKLRNSQAACFVCVNMRASGCDSILDAYNKTILFCSSFLWQSSICQCVMVLHRGDGVLQATPVVGRFRTTWSLGRGLQEGAVGRGRAAGHRPPAWIKVPGLGICVLCVGTWDARPWGVMRRHKRIIKGKYSHSASVT